MTSLSGSPHTVYTESVETLAGRVLDGLRTVQDAQPVRAHLDDAIEQKPALAAVRVLGPDLFAPQILTGTPFPAEDALLVEAAFEVFPPTAPELAAEIAPAWRDWATCRLLNRYGGVDLGIPRPVEDCAPADARDWRAWSARMAQLSPLALPGLDGPVPDAARTHPVALGRGLTRAMLRRDYPTAARLVRWLALVHGAGVTTPVDPLMAAGHLRLLGGGSARLTLDLWIAQRLQRTGPPENGLLRAGLSETCLRDIGEE